MAGKKNGRKIVGNGKKAKKSQKGQPLKIAALVLSAIQDLRETKGSTSRKILGYITYASNLPENRIKRQVKSALQRGVEYGILRRYRGHYFLPSGDEMERANRIADRFAKLKSSALDISESFPGQRSFFSREPAKRYSITREGNLVNTFDRNTRGRTRSFSVSGASSFPNYF